MLADIRNSIHYQLKGNNLTEEYFLFNSKYYQSRNEWLRLFNRTLLNNVKSSFTIFDFSHKIEERIKKENRKNLIPSCYFAVQKNEYIINSIE
jgi:hypothetical protein